MKKIAKIFLSAVFLFGIWSCNKQENKVVLQGGTPPVLTASSKDSIPVSFAHKDEKAIQITWTNPNYQFNTGISSLDVNYTIEIDTAGANFTNPNKSVISIGTDLSKSFTQNELNNQLLALQLAPDVSHNIQIRVTSMLLGGAEPLTSNVLSFKVTPFTLPPV
ncbi:MAG: SusE domain-containing protein, partial [Chitinophagaceae bacterium]|nr:SusE domain-containing protein [Chitinophagaceae bacterium]